MGVCVRIPSYVPLFYVRMYAHIQHGTLVSQQSINERPQNLIIKPPTYNDIAPPPACDAYTHKGRVEYTGVLQDSKVYLECYNGGVLF